MSIPLSTPPPQQLQEQVKKKVLFASIFLLTAVFFMQNITPSVFSYSVYPRHSQQRKVCQHTCQKHKPFPPILFV